MKALRAFSPKPKRGCIVAVLVSGARIRGASAINNRLEWIRVAFSQRSHRVPGVVRG
jgi:hypothetical protein